MIEKLSEADIGATVVVDKVFNDRETAAIGWMSSMDKTVGKNGIVKAVNMGHTVPMALVVFEDASVFWYSLACLSMVSPVEAVQMTVDMLPAEIKIIAQMFPGSVGTRILLMKYFKILAPVFETTDQINEWLAVHKILSSYKPKAFKAAETRVEASPVEARTAAPVESVDRAPYVGVYVEMSARTEGRCNYRVTRNASYTFDVPASVVLRGSEAINDFIYSFREIWDAQYQDDEDALSYENYDPDNDSDHEISIPEDSLSAAMNEAQEALQAAEVAARAAQTTE